MKKMILPIAFLVMGSFVTQAQDMKMPVPSPASTLKQDFSTSNIEISYNRPSANGRQVFGGLVPYGQVWRTGANSSTAVTFGEDVIIGGQTLMKGTYTMYAIPNKDSWTVIFNTTVGGWGSVKPETDVLKVEVKPLTSNQKQETLDISVDNIDINSCDIVINWENTIVKVPVTSNNDARITKYYEDAINNPRLPYQQAAQYYLDTDQHLDKALVYVNKAIESNQKAFWLQSLKAKILAKQGKKKEALAAAQIAVDLSKGTGYASDYQKVYDDIKNSK